jgi:hypothetical protein
MLTAERGPCGTLVCAHRESLSHLRHIGGRSVMETRSAFLSLMLWLQGNPLTLPLNIEHVKKA